MWYNSTHGGENMESWKWIDGYDGKYEVSSYGRVRSYATGKPKMLSLNRLNADGYIHISLRKNGQAKELLLNRIVASAFLPKPTSGRNTVNHINGIKTDNRVENLEWASRSEQMLHAYKNKLKKPVKEKGIFSFNDAQKEWICKNYRPYKSGFSINSFAKQFHVHHSVIEEILIEGKIRNV